MKLFLLAIVLVGLACIGMSLSIIFRKRGKFPEIHIGRNEQLKNKGITCATSQDRQDRKCK